MPFLQALGGVLGGGLDLFGAAQGMQAFDQARGDIQNLPGQTAQGLGGNFGQVSAGGQFQIDPSIGVGQTALAGQTPSLLQGGLFNDPGFQAAFNQNNISGALGQANQAFGQQLGPNALGGLGGLFGQAGGLAGQFGQQVAGGPQDFSGGLQGQLFGQAAQNLGGFGQTQADQLSALRAGAQPQQNRQFNQLQDRLFATGQLGSTGGGEQLRGLFEAQGQQDLGFQQEAFGRAMQQQGLGLNQAQAGQGLLGQNLGQFNQNVQNFQGLGGFQAGLEGQQFGQNLQGLGFNTSQGQNRLQAAQGLFGQGADVFGQQFGLGLGGMEGLLGAGQFGLQAARSPFELQASLLSGGGQHAQALGELAQGRGDAGSNFFGSLAKGVGSIFSDARLKDNITLIDKVGDLDVYSWDWNQEAYNVGAAKANSWGFVAQEVMKTHPEAVELDKTTGYMKVDYDQLLEV